MPLYFWATDISVLQKCTAVWAEMDHCEPGGELADLVQPSLEPLTKPKYCQKTVGIILQTIGLFDIGTCGRA